MTSAPASGGLTRQLTEYVAQIPGPVALRLAAAFAEVTASGAAPGLAVGDRAPDFTLPNATGEPVRLAARLARGPVVLSFYRGEWCPFCNLELRALQAALPRFQARGASGSGSGRNPTTACRSPKRQASPSTYSATPASRSSPPTGSSSPSPPTSRTCT